jgi:hypothetical protein
MSHTGVKVDEKEKGFPLNDEENYTLHHPSEVRKLTGGKRCREEDLKSTQFRDTLCIFIIGGGIGGLATGMFSMI